MVYTAIPDSADKPNLLNGLVVKHAEIAGQIEDNQNALHKLVADLDAA